MRCRTACWSTTMLLTAFAVWGWGAAPASAGDDSGFSFRVRIGGHDRHDFKKHRRHRGHRDRHGKHRDRHHGGHDRHDGHRDRHHRDRGHDRHQRGHFGRHHGGYHDDFHGYRHGRHGRHFKSRYRIKTPTVYYRYEKRYVGVPRVKHTRIRTFDHRSGLDRHVEVYESERWSHTGYRGSKRSDHVVSGTVKTGVSARRSDHLRRLGHPRLKDVISIGLRGDYHSAVQNMRRMVRHGPDAVGRMSVDDASHRRIGELIQQYRQRMKRGQGKTDALFMIAALQHLRGEHAAARSAARAARSFGDHSRSTAKLAASIERSIEGGA